MFTRSCVLHVVTWCWSRGADVVKLALWLRLRAALIIVIIYNVKTIAKQKYNVRTIIHVLTVVQPVFYLEIRES